jgi:hypothetical protein
MSNPFSTLVFADFAQAMRPTGAFNRISLPGSDRDMVSFSVYMNGPLAKQLSEPVQQQEFKDVMVTALTEKLGLDPKSFRDNLKVCEIVATRAAWLDAVLQATLDQDVRLSSEVMADYEILADKETATSHPWIQAELEKQVMLSMGLKPALESASAMLGGRAIKDRAPLEISAGKVVAQNLDFTVQHTHNGEVVTHENRRLQSLPTLGEDVTVSYYRGAGQVVDSLDRMKVSQPFIDAGTQDLAVMVSDADKEQVVLFNSLAGFSKFVEAHALDKSLVEAALAAREASPKAKLERKTPERVLTREPYLDQRSGCIAVDFKEAGIPHSALFGSAGALALAANEFGVTKAMISSARQLEASSSVTRDMEANSKVALGDTLFALGYREGARAPFNGEVHMGRVVAESALHVAMDAGRGKIIGFDKRELNLVVGVGESMKVKYQNGKGQVSEVVREANSLGR